MSKHTKDCRRPEITVRNCKMIYKMPQYPIYLILEYDGKHYLEVKNDRGIKNNEIFSLMGVSNKIYEIPHQTFDNYITKYNAYCIYIDDLWKVKGE